MFNLWNWLDWALALIVLLSTLSGVSEGFTRGLIVAASGYQALGDRLGAYIHSASLAHGVAFLILFVAVLIVGGLIAGFAQKLVKTAGMRWLDRFLGLFFGLLRGILVDAVVIMAMLAFSIKAEAVRSSHLTPSIIRASQATAALMPPEFRKRFDAGLDDLKRALVKAEKRTTGNEPSGR